MVGNLLVFVDNVDILVKRRLMILVFNVFLGGEFKKKVKWVLIE